MATSEEIRDITHRAVQLVEECKRLGLVLDIEHLPVHPLSMGNTQARVRVREHLAVFRAREADRAMHGPVVEIRVRRSSLDLKISDREWAAQSAGVREGCTVRVPGVGEV